MLVGFWISFSGTVIDTQATLQGRVKGSVAVLLPTRSTLSCVQSKRHLQTDLNGFKHSLAGCSPILPYAQNQPTSWSTLSGHCHPQLCFTRPLPPKRHTNCSKGQVFAVHEESRLLGRSFGVLHHSPAVTRHCHSHFLLSVSAEVIMRADKE